MTTRATAISRVWDSESRVLQLALAELAQGHGGQPQPRLAQLVVFHLHVAPAHAARGSPFPAP